MKTKVRVPLKLWLKNSLYGGAVYNLKLLLARLGMEGRGAGRLLRAKQESELRINKGPLSPEEIHQISLAQKNKVDSSVRARSKISISDKELRAVPLEVLSTQQKGTLLLVESLKRFGKPLDIRSVINIGARVDFALCHAASFFPDTTFTSVDFQENLAEHNALLPQRGNWGFKSGYALQLLKEGALQPDGVFMTSTSVLFNQAEAERFFEEIGKKARLVVLNEPWWPPPSLFGFWRIVKPETIRGQSFCSGHHGNYHHNYIKLLEENGFEIISSEMVAGQDRYYTLQVVAVKKI